MTAVPPADRELGFVLDDGILRWPDGPCRPASFEEAALFHALEASLAREAGLGEALAAYRSALRSGEHETAELLDLYVKTLFDAAHLPEQSERQAGSE